MVGRRRQILATVTVLAAPLFACGAVLDFDDDPEGSGVVPEAGAAETVTPLGDAAPSSCGPDQGLCVASCPPGTCITPAHVSSFGTLVRANGLGELAIDVETTGDSDTGELGALRGPNADPSVFEVKSGIGFVRQTQDGSVRLAVWVARSVAVRAPLGFKGQAAIAVGSATTLEIGPSGTVDVSASDRVPGPGGMLGGALAAPGLGCGGGGASSGTSGSTNGGGGGGGFGTNGGPGGTGPSGGGAGGSAGPCAAALARALVGGSGGAGGDNGTALTGPCGGGGGGAVQLTALGTLVVDGAITAGGGAGLTPDGNSRDGAGGGSGGAIYLESPDITIGQSGGLFANGGGGGSGSSSGCASGMQAQNGAASLTPASGSTCAEGHGGAGAAASSSATAGVNAGSGGGGGGGLGRIVLRTRPDRTPSILTATLSPGRESTAFSVDQTLK